MSDVGMPYEYKFVPLTGNDESNEARLNMEVLTGWELVCVTPDHRAILKRLKKMGRKPSETK